MTLLPASAPIEVAVLEVGLGAGLAAVSAVVAAAAATARHLLSGPAAIALVADCSAASNARLLTLPGRPCHTLVPLQHDPPQCYALR